MDPISAIFLTSTVAQAATDLLSIPKRRLAKKHAIQAEKYRRESTRKSAATTTASNSIITDNGAAEAIKASEHEEKSLKLT